MGAPSSHGGDGPRAPCHRRNCKFSAPLRRGLRRPVKSSISTSMVFRGPFNVGLAAGHASVPHSHHPSRVASSRDGSCVRGLRKRLARDGTLDNYFRALAMAADGVSQTVRLTDRQISRPERRHHAFIHPDGPAVLLFDNVKCDHRVSPHMGYKEFQIAMHSTSRRITGVDLRQMFQWLPFLR